MDNEYLRKQRRTLIGEQNITLIGEAAHDRQLEEQQVKVAMFVRDCYFAGFDPVTLAQSLLVGACWLGDNTNISRQNMSKIVMMAKLPDGAVLSPLISSIRK